MAQGQAKRNPARAPTPVLTTYAIRPQETNDRRFQQLFAAKCHSRSREAPRAEKTQRCCAIWSLLSACGTMHRRTGTAECTLTRGGLAMTFKEVLAQVIDWLQQDRRISYRALKRQFALDDEYLDDLKMELIAVRQVAVEQEGTMLVWRSDAAPTATSVSTVPS